MRNRVCRIRYKVTRKNFGTYNSWASYESDSLEDVVDWIRENCNHFTHLIYVYKITGSKKEKLNLESLIF